MKADPNGPILYKAAELIKAEELYSCQDFVVVEKKLDVDIFDIDTTSKSLRVVSMSESLRSLVGCSLHLSRNIGTIVNSIPENIIILHLNFPKKAFITELDFFANLQSLDELQLLEKQVSSHLNRLFMPKDCLVELVFKLYEGTIRLSGLIDLM